MLVAYYENFGRKVDGWGGGVSKFHLMLVAQYESIKVIGCLQIRGLITIAAAAVNKITLLRRCADAAAAAAKRRRAALRLALVVLEHEEVVGTNLNFGTQ